MRSRIQATLSLFVAAVVGATFVPTAAQAAGGTAPFNLSATSGRPGVSVVLSQDEPCPNLPDGPYGPRGQDVYAVFTDAAGIRTEYNAAIGVSRNGTWNHTAGLVIPVTTTQGTGTIEVRCAYWDFDTQAEVASLTYAPQSYTVSGTAPRFTSSPARVQPGGAVTLSSVDACPSDRIQGSISSDAAVSNFDLLLDSTGDWTLQALTSTLEMDGSRTPFPAGNYTIAAYCLSETSGHTTQRYANQSVIVGNATPPPANCDEDVVFIAVPGSGQAFNGATNISVTPEVETAYNGFKQVLTNGKTIRLRVLDYPALPVETINSLEGLREYLTGKNAGVRKLRNLVTAVRAACPSQAIVLAGFSQGALVVHEYMIEFHRVNIGGERQAITAAVTIADPAQIKNSPVLNFGDAPPNAMGVCQTLDVKCFKTETFGDIPQMYKNRTTTVCTRKDLVCDFNRLFNGTYPLPGVEFNKGKTIHLSYAGDTEVQLAGKRAARQVNQRW